jgi:hypothetical protein
MSISQSAGVWTGYVEVQKSGTEQQHQRNSNPASERSHTQRVLGFKGRRPRENMSAKASGYTPPHAPVKNRALIGFELDRHCSGRRKTVGGSRQFITAQCRCIELKVDAPKEATARHIRRGDRRPPVSVGSQRVGQQHSSKPNVIL